MSAIISSMFEHKWTISALHFIPTIITVRCLCRKKEHLLLFWQVNGHLTLWESLKFPSVLFFFIIRVRLWPWRTSCASRQCCTAFAPPQIRNLTLTSLLSIALRGIPSKWCSIRFSEFEWWLACFWWCVFSFFYFCSYGHGPGLSGAPCHGIRPDAGLCDFKKKKKKKWCSGILGSGIGD